MAQRWPERLWLVRHGQSAGNVARDAAMEAALHRIAIDGRDVDVPLSSLGERQADALGRWFAEQPEGERPDALLVSPYLRAVRTAELFREAGGLAGERLFCRDERLREKEFGILDGLTTPGVAAVHPDQAEFRRLLGKFYHRPPGGESWCDVILRLRSVLDTVSLHYAGRRVMIVCHQVVVLCCRYIIERLDEAAILEIDKAANVANCSVTEYRFDPDEGASGGMELVRYNSVVPVEAEGEEATADPDPIIAARG
jgi:ribonuclease H / adenosylcobalamin/alpha-ribazole phosphatase